VSYRASVRADPSFVHDTTGLAAAARAALAHESSAPGDVSIILTDEGRIREMNRSYAGTDIPTDVLSFADGEADPDSGRVYFGDVVICVPVAEAQARRAEHPLVDELSLLTVHGVLHLLGHDHAQRVERQRMWAAQAEILSQLGLSGVVGAA
jgi:probable rRNA maturation factor